MYIMEAFSKCNISQSDVTAVFGAKPIQLWRLIGNNVRSLETRNSILKIMHGRIQPSYKCQSSFYGSLEQMASYEDSSSSTDGEVSEESENSTADGAIYFGKATSTEELAAMRENVMRAKLLRKLSDANLYGRYMKRQLIEKEEALLKCKNELETMEMEIKNLMHLAQEIASEGPKPVSRRINGKYIQSHLAMKLNELYEQLVRQIEDIDAVCYRDVPLIWCGMAEDVQVMGSFDGWSQGQPMNPEETSTIPKFSTTIKLRPGQYQIKFLVDGEWQLSGDLPQVGEGMTVNNLLVVT